MISALVRGVVGGGVLNGGSWTPYGGRKIKAWPLVVRSHISDAGTMSRSFELLISLQMGMIPGAWKLFIWFLKKNH